MISLLEVAVLLLCIAVSGLHVLQPVRDYYPLEIAPRNPAVPAAVTLLALAITYFAGIILVYLHIAPAPAPPALLLPPVAQMRLLPAMACALLLLLAIVQLVPRLGCEREPKLPKEIVWRRN